MPRRIKTAFLTDADIHHLAAYAAQLRRKADPDDCYQLVPALRNTVKTSLTRKRRRRHVENDEYADFLRRALSGYARRIARATSTPSPASTRWSPKRAEQLAEAVFLLRVRGYSWTDIGLRLGVTRQAAQQRWGTPA